MLLGLDGGVDQTAFDVRTSLPDATPWILRLGTLSRYTLV
jgi:hypothetical protein